MRGFSSLHSIYLCYIILILFWNILLVCCKQWIIKPSYCNCVTTATALCLVWPGLCYDCCGITTEGPIAATAVLQSMWNLWIIANLFFVTNVQLHFYILVFFVNNCPINEEQLPRISQFQRSYPTNIIMLLWAAYLCYLKAIY